MYNNIPVQTRQQPVHRYAEEPLDLDALAGSSPVLLQPLPGQALVLNVQLVSQVQDSVIRSAAVSIDHFVRSSVYHFLNLTLSLNHHMASASLFQSASRQPIPSYSLSNLSVRHMITCVRNY